MGAPLAGVRVIAVEQYGAGPWGTLYLADLGAEVIKIENPREGGDMARDVGPHFFGPRDSHFFQTFNRNKRSITVDLQQPEGQRILRGLAARCDALLDNLRGDLPSRLGLTFERLREVNPRIVCAHLSAYGRTGSRANWPGYDYLMQAEAGHMALTGEPDGPPTKFGLSIVDLVTGLTAAYALLAGVIGARESGEGRDLDVSLFDTALHNLNYPATWYLNAGAVTGRLPRSAHPSLVPSQLYRTRDSWIMVMCNKERFWGELVRALGHPEWADDPDFADFASRRANRERVNRMLDEAFGADTTAGWLRRLAGRVPVAPVSGIGEALDSAFVAEQGRVAEFTYPDGRTSRQVATPIRTADRLPQRSAPALGADTEAVLGELGYDAGTIARLREEKVI